MRRKIYNILRWSEKYTKTDMVYLFKEGSILSVGQIYGITIGLALSIAFANLVPKDTFGVYKFVLALGSMIAAFSLTGMRTAVTRGVAKGFEGTVWYGFITHLKWSVGMFVIALIGALYYFINDNLTLAASMLLVGCFSPLMAASELGQAFLGGRKLFQKQTYYSIIQYTLPSLALLGAIYATENPLVILAVYFIGNATMALLVFWRIMKTYKPEGEIDHAAIGFGKHLSLMGILERVAGQLDKILIFHFLGAAELATYAFAVAIPRYFQNINKVLKNLILPKYSDQDMSRLKKSIYHKALLMGVFSSGLFVAYFFSAPYIYGLLFPQYMDAVVFSQVFALNLLLMPTIFFSQALLAHLKRKQMYVNTTAIPIIKIALFLVLLPLYGIWGAIAALLVTQLLNFLLLMFLVHRLN